MKSYRPTTASRISSTRGYFFNLLILVFLFTSGCASKQALKRSNAALEAGDYIGATNNAIKVLKKKSDNSEAQHILRQAFPEAVQMMLAEAKAKETSQSLNDLDAVVTQYKSLVALNHKVASLPMRDKSTGSSVSIETTDFTSEYRASKGRAADGYAANAKSTGDAATTRDAFKRAAGLAKRAMAYVPGHNQGSQLYSQYREEATLHVAVGTLDDLSGHSKYGRVGSIVAGEMMNHISSDQAFGEFANVYQLGFVDTQSTQTTTRTVTQNNTGGGDAAGEIGQLVVKTVGKLVGVDVPEGSGKKSQTIKTVNQTTTTVSTNIAKLLQNAREQNADYLLIGEITQILIEDPKVDRERRTETKKVTLRKEKYTDENGKEKERKIKGNVSAHIDHYTHKAVSTIRYSYRLIDVETNQVWQAQNLSSQDEYVYTWAKQVGGDKRALSGSTKREMGKDANVALSQADRVDRLINLAGLKLADDVKGHVK